MTSQKITELSHIEARNFFMKHSSYINFELPEYINFEELLTLVSPLINNQNIEDICKKENKVTDKPSHYENVNHVILSNKDGAYSWRPMQIIHPVLYISLVKLLTKKENWEYIQERFKSYSKADVSCISIPRKSDGTQSDKASQVKTWWERIEQHSINKALEYNYVFITDITDCYASIYTHSIEWALDKDGKEEVKKRLRENRSNKSKQTLGQAIDITIRNMNYNQTNGIPQGSTIMDFIAEIVLGYADEQLTKKIKEEGVSKAEYHIVRYRDDYRIFVNDPNVGHKILKLLSIVLFELGLKMNAAKTLDSSDIILSSVKKEKLERILISPTNQTLQKEVLRIYQLSRKYPNSGLLVKELSFLYDKLDKPKKYKVYEDLEPVIVILAMIAYLSPRVVNWVSAIISILLKKISDRRVQKELVLKIHNKFKTIPQTGFIDIWLQRISAPLGIYVNYSDSLTKIALEKINNSDLWKCDWLKDEVKNVINLAKISDFKIKLEKKTISPVIQREEVELFKIGYF